MNALNLTSWTSRRRTWGTPPTPTSSSIILLKSMTRFWTFTLKTSKSFQELVNKKDLGYILEVTRDTSWGDGHCSSFDDSFLMSYFTTRDVLLRTSSSYLGKLNSHSTKICKNVHSTLNILFSSNHNIHKSFCASDPLIERF